MIVADTGAVVALVDADDRHHAAFLRLFEADPDAWVLPWAIFPEVDYLLDRHVGPEAARAFLADVAGGAFTVEWGAPEDLTRAHELGVQYAALRLGLVDGVIAAVAECLRAASIATLDLRDFGALRLRGSPRLLPRDTV